MSQHCQRDITNTPSRPMKLLWLSKGSPGSFQPPPVAPGRLDTSQELAVSIPGNVLGNIAETCVLCHVKNRVPGNCSFLFFSAVWSHVNKFWFPGTFCYVPRNLFKNSQERFLGSFFRVPRWPIQAGPCMGLVCRKNEFEIMNEYGV